MGICPTGREAEEQNEKVALVIEELKFIYALVVSGLGKKVASE